MKPTNLKQAASRWMEHICHSELPNTATELAKATAIEIGHDYWLDDPDHWIWELALQKYDEFYDFYLDSDIDFGSRDV